MAFNLADRRRGAAFEGVAWATLAWPSGLRLANLGREFDAEGVQARVMVFIIGYHCTAKRAMQIPAGAKNLGNHAGSYPIYIINKMYFKLSMRRQRNEALATMPYFATSLVFASSLCKSTYQRSQQEPL